MKAWRNKSPLTNNAFLWNHNTGSDEAQILLLVTYFLVSEKRPRFTYKFAMPLMPLIKIIHINAVFSKKCQQSTSTVLTFIDANAQVSPLSENNLAWLYEKRLRRKRFFIVLTKHIGAHSENSFIINIKLRFQNLLFPSLSDLYVFCNNKQAFEMPPIYFRCEVLLSERLHR